MYGRSPGRPEGLRFEVSSIDRSALGGQAVRKQVTVYFFGTKDGPKMDLLLYLPAAARKPVPVFPGAELRRAPDGRRRPGYTARPTSG